MDTTSLQNNSSTEGSRYYPYWVRSSHKLATRAREAEYRPSPILGLAFAILNTWTAAAASLSLVLVCCAFFLSPNPKMGRIPGRTSAESRRADHLFVTIAVGRSNCRFICEFTLYLLVTLLASSSSRMKKQGWLCGNTSKMNHCHILMLAFCFRACGSQASSLSAWQLVWEKCALFILLSEDSIISLLSCQGRIGLRSPPGLMDGLL